MFLLNADHVEYVSLRCFKLFHSTTLWYVNVNLPTVVLQKWMFKSFPILVQYQWVWTQIKVKVILKISWPLNNWMACPHLWILLTELYLKPTRQFKPTLRPILLPGCLRKRSCSQVGDAGLPDSGGDGFHSRADGVEQVGQLSRPLGLSPLLQDKPGEGQDVGVEGCFVRHLPARLGTGTWNREWGWQPQPFQLKSEL